MGGDGSAAATRHGGWDGLASPLPPSENILFPELFSRSCFHYGITFSSLCCAGLLIAALLSPLPPMLRETDPAPPRVGVSLPAWHPPTARPGQTDPQHLANRQTDSTGWPRWHKRRCQGLVPSHWGTQGTSGDPVVQEVSQQHILHPGQLLPSHAGLGAKVFPQNQQRWFLASPNPCFPLGDRKGVKPPAKELPQGPLSQSPPQHCV